MTIYGLFIGLNYRGKSHELKSCELDAADFARMYAGMGVTKVYTAMKIVDLHGTLSILTYKVKDGDKVVISYSGHGTQQVCKDGTEADGFTECLVLDDGIVTDDCLADMMRGLFAKKISIVFYLDACHSGTMLDLSYQATSNDPHITRTPDVQRNHVATVLSISACSDSQTDADGQYNGALTSHLKQFLATDPDQTLANMLIRLQIPGQRVTYSMNKPLHLSSNPFTCDLIPSVASDRAYKIRGVEQRKRGTCIVA